MQDLALRTAMAVPEDVDDDQENYAATSVDRDLVQATCYQLLVVSYYISEQSKDARPCPRPQPGEQDELSDRHAR